jgi:hypothetical protein
MADTMNSETFLSEMLGKLLDQILDGHKAAPPDQQQQLQGKVPFQDANFFTWCTPGIPVTPDDFTFLKGLRRPLDREKYKDLTDVEKQALQGDEAYQLTTAMDNFSLLVDTVPEKSSVLETGVQVWKPQQRISHIYESVLKNCEVADTPSSPEAEQRKKNLRDLVTQTVEKTDADTGATFKEERPTALVANYLKYQKAYADAYEKYTDLMMKALTGNAGDVQKASMLGPTYFNEVTAAWDMWESQGQKSKYESIQADLQQLEGVSMSRLKSEYLEIFRKAQRTSLLDGENYSVSRLVPAGFYESSGWTGYSFSSSQLKSTQSSRSVKGSAGGMWGFIGGARGNYQKLDTSGSINLENLSVGFELTQVPAFRSWLREDFLMSDKWRPKGGTGELLSNGKPDNPQGILFAYPTVIIFARNISVTKSIYDRLSSEVSQNAGASGGFSLGPFSIGGSGSYNKSDRKVEVTQVADKMVAPGMQIIGFRNHVLPLSPNPDQKIQKWI